LEPRARTHSLIVGTEFIDQYGHVNYKAYPALFEKAQDAYMAHCNTSFEELETRDGMRSVVVAYDVVIKSDLKAGKLTLIETSVALGNTSMTFSQVMRSCGALIATLKLVVVFVNAENMREKVVVPVPLRTQLLE
jgi:acyl-CoA thioesterase FadM